MLPLGFCEAAPVATPAVVGALLLSVSMLRGPAHRVAPEVETTAEPKPTSAASPLLLSVSMPWGPVHRVVPEVETTAEPFPKSAANPVYSLLTCEQAISPGVSKRPVEHGSSCWLRSIIQRVPLHA